METLTPSTPLDATESEVSLGLYAEKAYLDYAVSVVKGRALPDVADGQKPVQRRILYAMDKMGLRAGSKPVKSARVVGDVLGKYHPHGDQAAYDAMVRMAQHFSLRYPLIDGQGNFGSRDGDGAAAMRYTEARLTPMASLLLDELNEGTVDFAPNYDGQEEEPVQFPARLPMVLLNGASGIAVGMATEIPSHHLGEIAQACVALLKNPSVSDSELFALVPGPDFHGGAQIISPPEVIEQVYQQGRGSLKVRARWVIEELARGQWQLVMTELPPNTSCQKVLEEIEAITNPVLKKGKKTLTLEQQQAKASMLALLDSVRDESGKEADVRLVFEPKSSRIDKQAFITALLASTSLESSVPVNLVSIGIDGRPQQKSLRSMLNEWLQFRHVCVTRRSQHRLNKVNDRIHVLEGRQIVYLNVDAVIQCIRDADEPKVALMAQFALSERQADDILEMRLRQLARLEGFKIEQELLEKRDEQAQLQALLADPRRIDKLIIKEIQADAKRFGDPRRTLIETAEKAVQESRVVDEPMTVLISQKGWLRARHGHGLALEAIQYKAGDAAYGHIECRSVDTLIALCSNGRFYSVPVSQLPTGRGDGQPITAMVDIDSSTQVLHWIAGAPDMPWLLLQQNDKHCMGFIATLGDMHSRHRTGKQFVKLATDATLLPPVPLAASVDLLGFLSEQQHLLIFSKQEIKQLPDGGQGTILCALATGDRLQTVLPVGEEGLRVVGTYRKKQVEELLTLAQLQPFMGKRAKKGKPLSLRLKQSSLLPV